ncbi:MAG: PKD domain-containing protein [Thermoplasmata archaeon]
MWLLLGVLLILGLSALPGALAASPSYTLVGYVKATTGGVPAGIVVDLVNSATHQTFTTTTASGGQYTFTTAGTGGALAPGWWGLNVPAQSGISASGCNPCAALPTSQGPSYQYYSATALTNPTDPVYFTNVSGVSVLSFRAAIRGNVTDAGAPVPGATVELLDPAYNAFALANTTTNATGYYSLKAPAGSWVLETVDIGFPNNLYNFTPVSPTSGPLTKNPAISSYLAWGKVFQGPAPSTTPVLGGNVTVYEPATGYIYSQPLLGDVYDVGAYGAGFGGGANTFDVILSGIGVGTTSYALTVSGGNPTGGPNPKSVNVPSIVAPANYSTTLDFTSGFNKVNVSTSVLLGNYSTIPDLANASVGQLWAQLGLDYAHSLSFPSADLGTVQSWLQGAGPTFAATQANLLINDTTTFGQTSKNPTTSFGFSSTCSGSCGLASSSTMSYTWNAKYNSTSSVGLGANSYALSFNFRHPTSAEIFNYTVKLPTGYVLQNPGNAPTDSVLEPAGPGGTYTTFTLVSQPSPSPYSTANLTIVKYAGVIANVNITSSNFAFSSANILNSAHNSYTALVGVGENITLSGANSTFAPPGVTGIYYSWVFGDGGTNATSSPYTYHTYASVGSYAGNLTVTASSGLKNFTTFTVIVGAGDPTPVITTNATVLSANGQPFIWLNWGTILKFNSSGSNASVYPGASTSGIISISTWTISGIPTTNLSAAAGVYPLGNITPQFNGQGHYFVNTTVNGVTIPFKGWVYTVNLRVFDYAGRSSATSITVIVNDTQKPNAAITILDAAGHSVGSSGVIEAANHTAELQFSAVNSTDPNNGTIVLYRWYINNTANTTAIVGPVNRTTSTAFPLWLTPQALPYTVNLTVTDLAGNLGYDTSSVTVGINITTRPVLSLTNLTLPQSSMTDGDSYTLWVNVTNTVGTASTAMNVQVLFYLLSNSGSGNRIAIGGSPASVTFFGYASGGVVNTTAIGHSSISLAYNKTVRAQITFKPARTGNFNLYANGTASNEFYASYGPNQVSVGVTLNPNPVTVYEEYGAIAAAAIVVIIALVFFYRRRTRGPTARTTTTTSRFGLERGSRNRDKNKDKGTDEDDE